MRRLGEAAALALLALALGGVAWWMQSGQGRAQSQAQNRAQAQPAAASLAFRDVRVFDGERVTARTTVVVQDGRIVAVAPDAAIPAGIPVVAGQGRTLLPGLIDAHTHNWGDAQRDALRLGVTTELEMMGAVPGLADKRAHRATSAASDEADVWSAGAAVTVPGGHGTEYGFAVPTLKAGDDTDAFVQARIAEGSDFIKLMIDDLHAFGSARRMPTLAPAQIEAAIAAARRHGKLSIAHVSAQDDALHAVASGADGLAHAFIDQPASPALVTAMRAHRAFMVPTLSVIAGMQRSDVNARLADDARLQARLTEAQKAALRARFPGGTGQPQALDHALETVRRLHAAGVDVLAGTDAGNPGTAHGASLHGELALMVRAGLSPAQALRAATALPAARFGLADRGRIAPGLRADLLLVEGDPTADIEATRRIVGVWRAGHAPSADAATRAAPPLAEGEHLVSDFDSGDLATHLGSGWQAAGDRIMGGRSHATSHWIAGGAQGSQGAMRIEGEVVAGAPYPWAGATFSPGRAPMQPADLRNRHGVSLHIRGTPNAYTLIVLSGSGGAPLTHPIEVGTDWRRVHLPWAALPGIDLSQVRAIGVVAHQPGPLRMELDDVRLD